LPFVGQFLVARRRSVAGLSPTDQALVARLEAGPISLLQLTQDPVYRTFLMERVRRLVAQQAVMRSAFTPTDALHVVDRFRIWNTEAARVGAELLAAQVDTSALDFCTRVVEAVSDRVAAELVTKVLADEVAPADWSGEPMASGLMARALNVVVDTDLTCEFRLRQPVVAVGAPVAAYLPRTAEQLHTPLVLPEHAGVANAIGAVVGSVVQRATVLIRPVDFGEFYRVHLPGSLGLPENVRDFDTLREAIAYAEAVVPQRVGALAREAGAEQVEMHVTRTDHTGPVRDKIDDSIFLETVLTFSAAGRPATARSAS
jgi:N-methylhydantoinase A/oxoprolinase/acetone carboxylase beta subunit